MARAENWGRRWVFAIAVLVAVMGGIVSRSQALVSGAGTSTMSLAPVSQFVRVGQEVTLELRASGMSNTAAYEAALEYDPGILEFVRFQDSGLLGSTGRNVICPNPDTNDGIGMVEVGCGSTQITPAGVSGSGTLATITFRAKAEGETPIVFVRATLALPEGDDCCGPVEVNQAVVGVLAQEDPEPSRALATPTPNPAKMTPTVPAGARLPEYETLDGRRGGSGGGSEAGRFGATDAPRGQVGSSDGATESTGEVAGGSWRGGASPGAADMFTEGESDGEFPSAGAGAGRQESHAPGVLVLSMALLGGLLSTAGVALLERGSPRP